VGEALCWSINPQETVSTDVSSVGFEPPALRRHVHSHREAIQMLPISNIAPLKGQSIACSIQKYVIVSWRYSMLKKCHLNINSKGHRNNMKKSQNIICHTMQTYIFVTFKKNPTLCYKKCNLKSHTKTKDKCMSQQQSHGVSHGVCGCILFSVVVQLNLCVENQYLHFLKNRKRNKDLTHFPSFQKFCLNVLIFILDECFMRASHGVCISFQTAVEVLSVRIQRFNSLVSLGFKV